MIDKETAYAIFREDAFARIKKGTPHVDEHGLENAEFFFAPIAAFEAFKGDDSFLNPPGTPLTLVRKDTGEIERVQPVSERWITLRKTMTPVDYLAA